MKIFRLFFPVWFRWTAGLLLLLVAAVFIYFISGSEVTRKQDTYVYNLPFAAGAEFRVVQGYGGRYSHLNTAALDFAMPVGTPVHAAREGVVYAFKDNSNEGGIFSSYKNKANYIMIRHADGSYACYWHLKQNGVLVKHGPVKKGQLIGYSGATGMVLRPHLHFSVKRVLNYDKDAYLQTRFNTTAGVQLLSEGKLYKRPEE